MKKLLLAAAATVLFGGTAHASVIFGVDEVNNLVSFNAATPGTYLNSVAITGLTESIQALDFRPIDGTLYGLGADRVIYTIDTTSGVASAVSGVLALTGTEFGFDFNPTIDRLRIVSNTNQNYVFNPNDGSLTGATDLFYAAGDPNAGADPAAVASAYTSAPFGGTTQLYSFDTDANVLTKQANSAGTLTTVGAAGVPLGTRVSFDILGNEAYALNGDRLYSVNLATGAFTQVGTTPDALFGLAISAVPEPGTWFMMLAGIGVIGGVARRRQAVRTTVRYA